MNGRDSYREVSESTIFSVSLIHYSSGVSASLIVVWDISMALVISFNKMFWS